MILEIFYFATIILTSGFPDTQPFTPPHSNYALTKTELEEERCPCEQVGWFRQYKTKGRYYVTGTFR